MMAKWYTELLMMGLQRIQYIMQLVWQITYSKELRTTVKTSLTSENDILFQSLISTIKEDSQKDTPSSVSVAMFKSLFVLSSDVILCNFLYGLHVLHWQNTHTDQSISEDPTARTFLLNFCPLIERKVAHSNTTEIRKTFWWFDNNTTTQGRVCQTLFIAVSSQLLKLLALQHT
jgi:hypothetical protein